LGRFGDIIAFWRCTGYEVEVTPVKRQAFVVVITEGSRSPWVFAGFYVSWHCTKRRALWQILSNLADRGRPVWFMGDFNVLLEPQRSEEVHSPSLQRSWSSENS